MSKNNYSYFKRAKEGKRPGLSLTERDRDILEAVAKYRYLSTSMFEAKFPTASERGLRRRLKKLFQNAYLNRPKSQISLRIFSNQRELIYSLGPKGVKELVRSRNWKRSRLNWQTKEVQSPYLAHGLMVSRFRLTLELASKTAKEKADERQKNWLQKYKHHRGEPEEETKRSALKKFHKQERDRKSKLMKSRLNPDFDLSRWESGTFIQDHVLVGTRGNKEKFPVAPDGYFELKLNGGEENRKQLNFFFEADRNTMEEERFLKKLKAYWWLTRREAEENLKQKLGIESFRVVTVTTTENRKNDLVEVSKEADPKETGSEMFMFSCESNYSLEEPELILKRIFDTPTNEGEKSILE